MTQTHNNTDRCMSGSPRPEGWPKTERPLRIAILGWAKLSAQGAEGSGYNLSASELATGLGLMGHHVVYLRSGMQYSLLGGPAIRPTESWRGIGCFGLFNSTNLCPASSNFRNMAQECASPRESKLIVDWLKAHRIQVVHIHSLEGYGLDVIGAIRDAGLPVVVTTHNYHYVCPQVDLLHNETDCCMDYDGGRRCVGCLEAPHPKKARRNRAILQSSERMVGFEITHTLRHTIKVLLRHSRSLLAGNTHTKTPLAGDVVLPDPEAAHGFDPGSASHPGTIEHGLGLLVRDKIDTLGRVPIDANERFLESRTVQLQVLNDYGTR